MITTVAIIDRINEWKGWTDYRTAKMLEIPQSTISQYRHNGIIMSDKTAIKAAEILGLSPEFIVANIHFERAMNSDTEETMQGILKAVEKQFSSDKKAANG